MSDTLASLRRKISSAGDLQSVVRTMKAMAASSVGQYERSVQALADYDRTVQLGLGACLREDGPTTLPGGGREPAAGETVGAIVFGSDQGLVGRFNDVVADHATRILADLPGEPRVWAVGARVHSHLQASGLSPTGLFAVPSSVQAITPLVGQIQMAVESLAPGASGESASIYIFHNRPRSGALYDPVSQRLLPLDARWRQGMAGVLWPTGTLPEVVTDARATLGTLIREHVFISIFRACAESLASENASRLAAMERADRNIDELLGSLHGAFHRLRQGGIDEELFDVISGFEALGNPPAGRCHPPAPARSR